MFLWKWSDSLVGNFEPGGVRMGAAEGHKPDIFIVLFFPWEFAASHYAAVGNCWELWSAETSLAQYEIGFHSAEVVGWLLLPYHPPESFALIPKLALEQDALGPLGSCVILSQMSLFLPQPQAHAWGNGQLRGSTSQSCLSNTEALQLHPALCTASQRSWMMPIISLNKLEIEHRGAQSFLAVRKQNLMECISVCPGRNFSTIFWGARWVVPKE